MTNIYNTELTPNEEQEFQSWVKQNPGFANSFDYDARGFWKSGASRAENGHGSDKWKKPNHPTFSDQSIYHGVDGNVGGKWEQGPDGNFFFSPGQSNTQHWSKNDLSDYFKRVEAGNMLLYPSKDYSKIYQNSGSLY